MPHPVLAAGDAQINKTQGLFPKSSLTCVSGLSRHLHFLKLHSLGSQVLIRKQLVEDQVRTREVGWKVGMVSCISESLGPASFGGENEILELTWHSSVTFFCAVL